MDERPIRGTDLVRKVLQRVGKNKSVDHGRGQA
jgi:hypothetical protein